MFIEWLCARWQIRAKETERRTTVILAKDSILWVLNGEGFQLINRKQKCIRILLLSTNLVPRSIGESSAPFTRLWTKQSYWGPLTITNFMKSFTCPAVYGSAINRNECNRFHRESFFKFLHQKEFFIKCAKSLRLQMYSKFEIRVLDFKIEL